MRRGYPSEDFVRVVPTNSYEPVSRIHNAKRVVGQFTMMGLADLRARGEPLAKTGARSGYTQGEIKGINGMACYYGHICKFGQLKWGDEFTMFGGDSGSVNYHADPENPEEYIMVGGFNNARTWWPGGNFSWGTAAYHVHQTHGFRF